MTSAIIRFYIEFAIFLCHVITVMECIKCYGRSGLLSMVKNIQPQQIGHIFGNLLDGVSVTTTGKFSSYDIKRPGRIPHTIENKLSKCKCLWKGKMVQEHNPTVKNSGS